MPKKSPRADSAIPDSLRHFDELPDSAQVRVGVVAALFGCRPVTVWRRSRAGTLPAPRKHSPRITTWTVGELRKVLHPEPHEAA